LNGQGISREMVRNPRTGVEMRSVCGLRGWRGVRGTGKTARFGRIYGDTWADEVGEAELEVVDGPVFGLWRPEGEADRQSAGLIFLVPDLG
jgi:hypothetical protein